MIKYRSVFLFGLLLLFAGCSDNGFSLKKFEKKRVIDAAEKYISESPITVTASFCLRSKGGIHDYYSEGDYWWPDSAKPDGPYIRKDGLSNPNNFTAHRKALRRFSVIVPALAAAYVLTDDEKYAESAWKHISAWFVNSDTKMNPNFLYSQAIKGRVSGRGIGIIDAIHLVEVVQAIIILQKHHFSGLVNIDDVKNWFSIFLNWLAKSRFGIHERDNGNNHSVCWAMQAAIYAKFTGNKKIFNFCKEFYKNVIVPNQIAENGSFPKELARTKPYGYSLFNLDVMAALVEILSDNENNFWNFQTNDGKGIQSAVDFMFPYILNKKNWKYKKDVMYWEDWPVRQISLFFAWKETKENKYLKLWKSLNPDPVKDEIIRNYPIRQPLLWSE